MKTLLKILTLVAMVAKANAANTDLYFDLAEPKFNAYPASNRLVTLQLLTPFPGNLITYTSSASGTFWVSNAHLGNYSGVIKPKGNAGEIRFMVTVTATNLGLINADEITSLGGIQTYPTAGSAAWSIQASDRRYARVGDGGLSYSPQYGSENLTNWSLISTSALQTAAGLGGALTNNDTRGWTNDSSDGLWLNNYGKLVNGRDNEATGVGAHAEGVSTIASGDYAHSEGNSTVAAGAASHADGVLGAVTANWAYLWNGDNADPATNATQGRFQVRAPGGILLEGVITGNGAGLTNVPTPCSAALTNNDTRDITLVGSSFVTQGKVASGLSTTASGTSSHAEGTSTLASGNSSHAEGVSTSASGTASHAEGSATTASASGAHAEGNQTTASGVYSHAEGFQTTAAGYASHADGILGKVSADNAYLWNGNFTSPSTNETQYSFMVNAPGGIPLLGGVISGNGSGLTNLQASSVTTAVSNAWQFYTLFASNALYALIPSGGTNGGTATNVYFFPGNNTVWRTQNSSNVVDVVGTLTNNSSGTSTWALTAIAVTSSVTNEWRNTVIGASNTLWTAIVNSTNDLNVILRATMTNYVAGTSNGLYALIQVGGSAMNAINNFNGNGTNTTLYFSNANWGTNNTLSTNGASLNAILSGGYNTIQASSSGVVISGGESNTVGAATQDSTIAGGEFNTLYVSGIGNFIGAGVLNYIDGHFASIVGGNSNAIGVNSDSAIIGGGSTNMIKASAPNAFIGGGYSNTVSASTGSGGNSIPGGTFNLISGNNTTNSVALGYRAQPNHAGVFAFSDGSSASMFASASSNTFIIRAQNGVSINTNNPGGNALKVVGNVDSTVGFTVNGVSIGTANTGILTNNDTRFWTNQTGISTVDFIATGTLNVGTFNATNFNIYSPWNGALATNLTGDDTAYGSSWNGNTNVPTKNAVYDKIETLGSSGGGSSISNTVARQEYFYTNTANLFRSNQFTFSGGGMSGQTGYAPGASYANYEYVIDFTTSVQGNPEFFTATNLFHHISLFATNQLATGHTPAGISQSGALQTAGYAYHADFNLIELAFIHFRKTDHPFIFTNFQANLSNALNYVQRSNNIPSSFGTNANLYDGWGLVEIGYNSYSAAHYKRCCDLMAIMAMKAGQPLVASNYFWQAQVIRSSMTNLWDETRGLLRTCSQGTTMKNTHSLAANALAVLYDAVDDRIMNRIEEEFVKYSGHNNGFFQYGALRTTPIGECLDAAIDSDCDGTDASGTYQTGGYWPLTWGVEVVARRNPDLAEAMMKDMYSFGSQSNQFYEWWNVSADLGITAINKGSSNYVNSAGIPATYLLTGKLTDNERLLLRQAGDNAVRPNLGLVAGSNITLTPGATGLAIASSGGSGGGWTGNPNQFTTSGGQTNIKSGALVTNLTVDTLYVTNSAAGTNFAILDEGGSIINGIGITNGSVTIPGNLSVAGTITGDGSGLTNLFNIGTNTWTINTAFALGTNATFTSGAATGGIVGVANLPTVTERYGQMTIKATGTITFTNPTAFYTSDFVDIRVIASGNTAVIAVSVIPGFSTNLVITQFQ